MTRDLDADVIVVGGGISGLASAWGLQRRGARVLLLEAAPRVGGTIGTAREHDCLLESGPNSTLETTPLIGSLLDEVLSVHPLKIYKPDPRVYRLATRASSGRGPRTTGTPGAVRSTSPRSRRPWST